MSRATKPWIGVGVAAVGLVMGFVYQPVAAVLTFAGWLLAFVFMMGLNLPLSRLAAWTAGLINAAMIYWATGSVSLAAAAAVIGLLWVPTPFIADNVPRFFDIASAAMLPVAVAGLVFAGDVGWWRLVLAPHVALTLNFAIQGIGTLKDDWGFGVDKTKLALGQPMPEVELPFRNRPGQFLLSAERGRPVLLCWLRGDWCPVCQVMMRVYAREAPKLAEHGVKLVAVSPTQEEDSEGFLQDMGIDYAYLTDSGGTAAARLGITHSFDYKGDPLPLPVSLLIDSQGVLRYVSKPNDFSEDKNRMLGLLEAADA